MKKIISILTIFSVLLLSLPFAAVAEENPYEADLYAGKPKPGQENKVGGVQVWNDADTLYAQFEVNEPWCMTKVHLQVAGDSGAIPQTQPNKKGMGGGNPIPGNFAVNEEMDGCVHLSPVYEWSIEDIDGWKGTDSVIIAAHADVQKMDCVSGEPPYEALVVTDYYQGDTKIGADVREGRSDPDAVLTWDTNKLETDFFSLGFGGWIVVEFDCPVTNGEDVDLRVVEDTWGTYPAETADVYASNDGIDWIKLGEADNITRDTTYNWQTISEFDLGDLEYAKYIKVQDTTSPDPLPNDADGYDLNTIQALHECSQCDVVQSETAWAGEEEFTGANWARYFRYTITVVEPEWHEVDVISVPCNQRAYTESNISLSTEGQYQFEASGTCNWRVPDSPAGYLADAEYWLRNDSYGSGWTDMGIWSLAMWDGNPVEVEWGPLNETDHFYIIDYHVSADGPVMFFFNDDVYGDNSGELTVKIYQRY